MDLLTFFITVSLITISGALSPGPLTFGLILSSTKYGTRAGLEAAVGHTLIELPLAFLIFSGTIIFSTFLGKSIALIGGVALIFYGIMGMRNAKNEKRQFRMFRGLYVGLLFTALNPYFIVWWLTIGMALSQISIYSLGTASFPIMYISHVWVDYAWLIFIAFVANRGISLLKANVYNYITKLFSFILIVFGILFVLVFIGILQLPT